MSVQGGCGRSAPCVLLAASLICSAPLVAVGQASPERDDRRISRTVLFTIVGAAAGAAAGSTYALVEGNSQPGACDRPSCVLSVTVAAGALVGYIIGREFDQLHELRYRGGTPLFPSEMSALFGGEATALAARDSVVLVGGSAGVEVFRSVPDVLKADGRRAAGIKGIGALDLAPARGVVTLGASSGLYVFPPLRGPGTLVREGDVAATAASSDRVYFAVGTRVEAAPLSADSSRHWPGIDLGETVRDIYLDATRGVLWAITDRDLIALTIEGDSLSRSGSVRVRTDSGAGAGDLGTARRLTVDANRAAVAAGEAGVFLFDVADTSNPRRTTSWTAARFAYDVSLVGSRLFVAGGPDGMYVLDVGGPSPRNIGLARELGFVATLLSHGGYTYVVDRRGSALRRISSNF
ncbi:MAG: hypothetical protein ABR543_15485 [Gemmatimonadaceae bacterium]